MSEKAFVKHIHHGYIIGVKSSNCKKSLFTK